MSEGTIYKSNYPNVMFVHHKTPLLEISRSFPEFLCLTHHGTVATEAAYLEHFVLVSDASPYCDEDKFVNIYSSLEEYSCLIESWVKGRLTKDSQAKSSLLQYLHNRQGTVGHERWMENLREAFGFSWFYEREFLRHIRNIDRESEDYSKIHKIVSAIF
jgi:hypothetical protein